ncbi:glutamate carboxypeptidase [Physcia stellaris]|nr:glutamate carboxypeptidase [Physcia stellaris]
MHRYILSSLFLAAWVSGCIRDHVLHRPRSVAKRQTTPRVPLTPDESVLVNSIDNSTLRDWNYYYTHGAHLAGTNQSMAQWTADRWSENGFQARLDEYVPYLNYPVSHSLSLTYPNGSIFTAGLEEAVLIEDETTSYPNRIPTFNGYSFTGNATAEYVYVGRGQVVDFEALLALGVPLKGKIALAKYGGPFRGLKVKNAALYGMIGCVLFTDPGDDGNVTVENGYAPYPEGPARNPTSVQRGSVQFLSTYPGDPTTPGYPSKRDSPRADKSSVVPSIPSLPISYAEAIPLLRALDGFGTPGSQVNRTEWVGKLNVTYSTGPAPGAVLSMSNIMRDEFTPIWDAVGIINGTNQDEVLVIGNHRDAWIVGGAADPNSGTAIIVELSKAFGKLLATGWKPRRTIILCSWDGEEYGLVGSTEWVEEYVNWLTESAVAYLNIDIGISGTSPDLSATPELSTIATATMKKIMWPTMPNETLYDAWNAESEGEIGVLGAGSDYTSFLHKGISSLDVGTDPGVDDPVYHYHSNYDSYHWMSNYGDPGYHYHTAMGQYLTLLAYHLATDEILPYDFPVYTAALRSYYGDLLKTINSTGQALDTSELATAITQFESSANEAMALRELAVSTGDAALMRVVNHIKGEKAISSKIHCPSSNQLTPSSPLLSHPYNTTPQQHPPNNQTGKLTPSPESRDFQRGFTSVGGLPEREFYKHVVNAPGIDTGYAPTTFPGITEAVVAGNLERAREWVGRTSEGIRRAAGILGTGEGEGTRGG